MAQRNDAAAAPPDAGGNLGAFTRPEDTLQAPERGDGPHPDLQDDHHRPRRRQSRGSSMWLWLGLVGLVVLFALMAFYIR